MLGRYLVLWWRQLVLQQFLVVRLTVDVNKGGLSLSSGRGLNHAANPHDGFTNLFSEDSKKLRRRADLSAETDQLRTQEGRRTPL